MKFEWKDTHGDHGGMNRYSKSDVIYLTLVDTVEGPVSTHVLNLETARVIHDALGQAIKELEETSRA